MKRPPQMRQENLVYVTSVPIFKFFTYCHDQHTLEEIKAEGYFESMHNQMSAPGLIVICDKDQNYEQCAIKMKDGKLALQTFHFGKALNIKDDVDDASLTQTDLAGTSSSK